MYLAPLVSFLLFATGASFVAALIARRREDVAGRQLFVWLMGAIGTWSGLNALELVVPDQALKIGLSKLAYPAVMSVVPLWLLLVRYVAGHPPLRPRRIARLAIIPMLTVVLAWTNELHGWLWASITPATPASGVLVYAHGPWIWVSAVYNYGLLIAATVILIRALRSTPRPFHPQLRTLLVAGSFPWLGNLLYLTGTVPLLGLDLTPIAFMLTGLLTLWSLTRQQLFDLVPVARGVLLDHLHDGVLVLDRQQRIVDHNPAALRLSGLVATAIGQPLTAALPALARTVQTALTTGTAQMIEACGPQAVSVELQTTALHDRHGQSAGWLVLLHDVTVPQRLAAQLSAERDFALQVMQTMGEGLTVTNELGQFTFVNDAFAQLVGTTPAALLGRRPIELIIAEDHPLLLAALTMRRQGLVNSYSTRLRRADGQLITVQVTGAPRLVGSQFVGSVTVITDLSERIAAEVALRSVEQTLRSFFDSAGVMMGIVELGDHDFRHIADNAVTAAFFGTTVEAIRGQWASALRIPPPVIQHWLHAYRESERLGKPVQFDYTHERPNGRFWLAATVCCIGPAPNGQIHYSYVITDITARKELELQLIASQQQLEVANAQLRKLARTDGLTGLWNRTAFDERLAEETVRASRYHTPLSLLLLDIDHFKTYNDTYGHVAGDAVLRMIAQTFQEQSRQSDLAARYGGEEFAVILPNTEAEEAVLVAERIRHRVEWTAWPERGITISIGVVTFLQGLTVEQLVQLADDALYHAKAQGRNRVVHVRQIALVLGSSRADSTP